MHKCDYLFVSSKNFNIYLYYMQARIVLSIFGLLIIYTYYLPTLI